MPSPFSALLTPGLSPEFESDDLNKRYEEFRRITTSKQRSAIAALTGGLYIIAGGLDLVFGPEELRAQMLLVHVLIVPIVLFVTSALLCFPRSHRYGTVALILAPIIASIGNVVLVSQMREPDIWHTEIYLILFWVFTVSGLGLAHALLSASSVLAVVFAATVMHFDGSPSAFAMHVFWMSAACAFGIASCFFLERSSRTIFSYTVQLEQMAATDKLTGLCNRSKLDEVLQEEIERSTRHGPPFGVVLLDIDLFKDINDEFGHLVGDSVLIEVGRHILNSVRRTDTVARWGGEEFLIIFTGTTGNALERLAEKLRVTLSELPFEVVQRVTASFGVTTYQKGDTSSSLVQRADEALYIAKHRGRNCVVARDGSAGEEVSPISMRAAAHTTRSA